MKYKFPKLTYLEIIRIPLNAFSPMNMLRNSLATMQLYGNSLVLDYLYNISATWSQKISKLLKIKGGDSKILKQNIEIII